MLRIEAKLIVVQNADSVIVINGIGEKVGHQNIGRKLWYGSDGLTDKMVINYTRVFDGQEGN